MTQENITGLVVDPSAVTKAADGLDAMRDVRYATRQADGAVKEALAAMKKRGGEASSHFNDRAPAQRGQSASVATMLFDLVWQMDQIADDAEKELGRAIGDLSEWTRKAAEAQVALDNKVRKEMEA